MRSIGGRIDQERRLPLDTKLKSARFFEVRAVARWASKLLLSSESVQVEIDLARSSAPHAIKTDIAVIGAGAAGLTVARKLIQANLQVTLIESGGVDYERETADLNFGESVGEPYYALDQARLRFFGGTTAIWGGRCAELDPIDFERREWIPHSGWPITWEELQPWYAEARRIFDIDGKRAATSPLGQFGFKEMAVDQWSFDPRFDRFGYQRNKDLIEHRKMILLLHATVREIVPTEDGRRVAHLDIWSFNKKRVEIEAKTVILAAGGLENPRILLASNKVQPGGLGNGNNLVGRFFMEHPHARGGRVVNAPAWKLLNAFRQRRDGNARLAPLMKLTSEVQRERGLLNSAVTLAARSKPGGTETALKRMYLQARHNVEPTKSGRNLWQAYRRMGRAVTKLIGPIGPWLNVRRGRTDLAVVIRAEQSPNPDSRVMLSRDIDGIGMPRIKLHWRLQELDVRSASELIDCLERSFRAVGLGEVQKADWLKRSMSQWEIDPLISSHPIGGYHHMGTTRMSSDPKTGVTDAWGRVHGVENLYVCGSSLFPTCGWANPTLTIVALALRTAEKIANDRA